MTVDAAWSSKSLPHSSIQHSFIFDILCVPLDSRSEDALMACEAGKQLSSDT